MSGPAVPRVYYIDWLRILAVLLLIPFHVLRVFDDQFFYVKTAPESKAVGYVIDFIHIWRMPVLFFLAGCSTYFALHKRTGGQYFWERIRRLLVPLIFGFVVLVPPQTWYGARFNYGYTDSYWHYLASGDFVQWSVGFSLGQLWFVLWLLVFAVVALPFFVWGVRGPGRVSVQSFGRRISSPAWWIVPVAVLLAGTVVPDIAGRPSVFYFVVFVLGFVAMGDPEFTESAHRHRIAAFCGGVALALAWVFSQGLRDSLPYPIVARGAWALLHVAACWLILVGALGLGKGLLDRSSRTLNYLAAGSYPVYILHQTVIVVVAFYVVQLPVSRAVQSVLLFVAAVVGTFALFEVVRRWRVLRFLMGMKAPRRARVAIETGQVPAGGEGRGAQSLR